MSGERGYVRYCVLFLSLFVVSGCLENGGSCTLSVEPAVEVEIRDALTQDFLAVTPLGVARDGTYQDSLVAWSMTADAPQRVISLAGAGEREGTYSVHLQAEGYQDWDTAGIRVTEGECHVRTARFIAEVAPVQSQ